MLLHPGPPLVRVQSSLLLCKMITVTGTSGSLSRRVSGLVMSPVERRTPEVGTWMNERLHLIDYTPCAAWSEEIESSSDTQKKSSFCGTITIPTEPCGMLGRLNQKDEVRVCDRAKMSPATIAIACCAVLPRFCCHSSAFFFELVWFTRLVDMQNGRPRAYIGEN